MECRFNLIFFRLSCCSPCNENRFPINVGITSHVATTGEVCQLVIILRLLNDLKNLTDILLG